MKNNSELEEILNSNHHAFLLHASNREQMFLEIKNKVEDIFNENKIEKSQNFFLNLKVLDVDKAREIIRMGNIKYDNIKFIVISFYIATIETQNALLKFLEEPAKNIKIILIVSASTDLIPTVESRLYKINEIAKNKNSADSLALKFLKTKKIERIKMQEIKDILDAEDEYAKEFDKKERKDRELADNFLLELEKEIYLKLKDVLENKENHNLKKELLKNLNDLQDFKKYIKLASSSPKTIFEYLSLSVKEF